VSARSYAAMREVTAGDSLSQLAGSDLELLVPAISHHTSIGKVLGSNGNSGAAVQPQSGTGMHFSVPCWSSALASPRWPPCQQRRRLLITIEWQNLSVCIQPIMCSKQCLQNPVIKPQAVLYCCHMLAAGPMCLLSQQKANQNASQMA